MKIRRVLPWLIVGLVLAMGLIQMFVYFPPYFSAKDNFLMGSMALVGASILLPVTFASLGALVVTRQPSNRVGWFMVVTAIAWAAPLEGIFENNFPLPPAVVSPGLWVLLWLANWLWLLTFLPIFLIVLNFPDGQPLSHRWGWLNNLALGLLLFWAMTTMFWDEIGPDSVSWRVVNPIGFIHESVVIVFAFLFYLGLLILAGGSIASLFVRYRRAGNVERQQIKWFLFAGALSILAIGLTLIAYVGGPPGVTWLLLFLLMSILAVAIAIAIAILRYRLYDIDIIIRRTLTYGILTGLLALIYFVGVTLLQNLATSISGQDSPIAIVLTTLGIAVLFNPLRVRIQNFINRRFYRKAYNADKILQDFAATARDEVDVNALAREILNVADSTMQPETISLLLKED